MFPNLFTLGPFSFHTYGLLVALGAFLCLKITISLAKKDGFNSPQITESLYSLLFYILIGGIAGARIVYVILFWKDFSLDWLSILKVWEGGLVFYGGLIGAVLGSFLWKRKNNLPWRKVADWVAPGLSFGHALGRLGCFFAGCCYGRPTDKPWGVTFTHPQSLAPLNDSLHPTQIYEFLYLLLLGLFLLYRSKQKRAGKISKNGVVFLEYLLLYSIGRFAIEFFRADTPLINLWTPGQILSLALFLISIAAKKALTKD